MRVRVLVSAVITAFIAAFMVAVPAHADDFYTPPASISGQPGDVIKSSPGDFHFDPLKVTRPDARIQRLMYVSTGWTGQKTAVSGTLITPKKPWKGKGIRPLIAYAPGTQGMDTRCAPSILSSEGTEYEGIFLAGLIARGYQVIMTDYEGLGIAGNHPYVHAKVLGQNVLDSARAARRVNDDATPAKAPVFISGYSEGGNAAAGAAEHAKAYAPDVNLKAVYAGAVPADLAKLATSVDGALLASVLLYAVAALDHSHPELKLMDLLNDKGVQAVEKAKTTCVVDGVAEFALQKSSQFTKDGSTITDNLSRPDIAAALDAMKLGQGKPPVPTLVGQSLFDEVVPFAQNRDMARSWCRKGAKVRFSTTVVPTHIGGAVAMQPEVYAFFGQRTRGGHFFANCGWF